MGRPAPAAARPGRGHACVIRRAGPGLPRVRVADPDRQRHLIDVDVKVDGDYASATLPAPHLWQLVVIDPVSSPS